MKLKKLKESMEDKFPNEIKIIRKFYFEQYKNENKKK